MTGRARLGSAQLKGYELKGLKPGWSIRAVRTKRALGDTCVDCRRLLPTAAPRVYVVRAPQGLLGMYSACSVDHLIKFWARRYRHDQEELWPWPRRDPAPF